MTEKETKALKWLKAVKEKQRVTLYGLEDVVDTFLKVFGELNEYRRLGTLEEIEPYIRLAEKLNVCDLVRENAGLSNKIKFLESELESYKRIGTVEECQNIFEVLDEN